MANLQRMGYYLQFVVKKKYMMSNSKVEIKNTRYYQIINCHFRRSLYISSGAKDFQDQKAFLDQPNQDSLGQVWQIIQIDPNGWKKDLFQIVHTRSTLVLSRLKNEFFLKKLVSHTQPNQVRLRFGQWGSNQLFYLQQVNPNDYPNIYRFCCHENKHHYMYFDNYLRVEAIDPNNNKCHWELVPCFENAIINRSCYLENAYTSLAMDVPAGSTKKGCQLIQWPLNNRFNQRFNIYKTGGYYKIANLNSKLYLAVSPKAHIGQLIKQQEKADEVYQMWNLEYQGKNLYLIRSVKSPDFCIGVKQHAIKQQTTLILTNNQEYCLWRIIGFIPH